MWRWSTLLSNKEEIKEAFVQNLNTMYGKAIDEASINDKYGALSGVIRDYCSKNWSKTNKQYTEHGVKQVYYFSMEFLLGRLLEQNLLNVGGIQCFKEALAELGLNIEELFPEEPDPGLGNGGLGRLAACFMETMAALGLPGHGCGIRYKYGLFEQKIVDDYQVELPDNWLKDGYIWEFRKPSRAVLVNFGGKVWMEQQDNGRLKPIYEHSDSVKAIPYDIPMVGYQNNTVNTLRLWSAEPLHTEFDFSAFNRGDCLKAVEYQQSVGRISKILYPEDNYYEGQLLRLMQQYFFVSAGLQSIIRRFKFKNKDVNLLPDRVAVHINDTHPALAIPELMRILMDEEELSWETAWEITTKTISYTNHTIMPEALEKWPTSMLESLVPRIYMIIVEINRRFCLELEAKYDGDQQKIREMAVIVDNTVFMARLAIIGSYSVNGVAEMHTHILKKHIFPDYDQLFPHKINNKTNGIAHRRWLLKANPALAAAISDAISDSWINAPGKLTQLLHFVDDKAFQQRLMKIKQANKGILAKHIKDKYNITVDVNSLFDVQVKRFHSYKRQLLNVMHIMDLYNRLRENPGLDITPRTFIFAGKAAVSFYSAKQTVKLINVLANLINNDKSIQDKLKVVFIENYNVSLAEMIIPAADVSEQISTASKEASGTGNMKFMMNGAVTIGTLDGANVEIRDAVGDDNIIIFGLSSQQVFDYHARGGYSAWDIYQSDPRISTVLEQLINGFLPHQKEEFRPLYDLVMSQNDEFFLLKDFASYADAHVSLESKFRKRSLWSKMSINNIAQSGIFSSDRTIKEYAGEIWGLKPEIIK